MKYYDPRRPGSYAGAEKFYRSQSTMSRKEVKNWLTGEDAYTLHHPVRYHFNRNKVVVSGLDSQWDLDLFDMTNYRNSNDGYTYALLAVDILSHYVWTKPLKTKKGGEVAKAAESIFSEGRKPNTIRTDRGTEFTGVMFRKLMEKEGIHHFLTNNELKANYAERAIKTIKMRIARYFTRKQTRRWVDVLNDITFSYNNTYHRTIKRKPASVNKDNESEVWQIQYGGPTHKPDGAFKLKEGDLVRISHLRRTFQREYDERFSGEMFKVKTRKVRGGLNVYELEDWLGENVRGLFYEAELQRVIADPTGVFKVDKVLKTRKRRGEEKEYLIRWLHWPDKFNSWVKTSDMKDI